MANKRMFSKDIVQSDFFVEMSLSAQALYFHINMEADDDGFCDRPIQIMRMVGANKEDLRQLIERGFLMTFTERAGLVVVKHWRINNTLRADRYKPTNYRQFAETLLIKKNKSYTFEPVMLLGNDLEDNEYEHWQPITEKKGAKNDE